MNGLIEHIRDEAILYGSIFCGAIFAAGLIVGRWWARR